MVKKIVASILSSLLIISVVGCSSKTEEQPKPTAEQTADKVADNKPVLDGSWAKDLNRDEAKALYGEIQGRVQAVADDYSLEYKKADNEIKTENNVSTNDSYIYLDNKNPDPNKIESVYCGFKQYGSDLASGDITMKIGFNLNKDMIKEAANFKFEDTTMAAFSQAFMHTDGRDYTDLNQKIYDVITGKESNKTIENNLDGVRETVTVTDNFLLYKLETKNFAFK